MNSRLYILQGTVFITGQCPLLNNNDLIYTDKDLMYMYNGQWLSMWQYDLIYEDHDLVNMHCDFT